MHRPVGNWAFLSREREGVGIETTEAVVCCVYNLLFLECFGAWEKDMRLEEERYQTENLEQLLLNLPCPI